MRSSSSCILVLALHGVLFADCASAALVDRGGGLVYDDVLDVTWFQETNIGRLGGNDHATSKRIVESMSFYDTVRQTWWNDWRLPRVTGPPRWGVVQGTSPGGP